MTMYCPPILQPPRSGVTNSKIWVISHLSNLVGATGRNIAIRKRKVGLAEGCAILNILLCSLTRAIDTLS